MRLGFDAVATGHHARVASDGPAGPPRLLRGHDAAKDQSYVLSMLTVGELARVLLPVGELTKHEVRARAACARPAHGGEARQPGGVLRRRRPGAGPRERFLGERIELHPGRLVDRATGEVVGNVAAVELVTVGQRRGLGLSASRAALRARGRRGLGDGRRRLARTICSPTASSSPARTWVAGPLAAGPSCSAQASAHGRPRPAVLTETGVRYLEGPDRRVAPGQTVALYGGDEVVGSGIAA